MHAHIHSLTPPGIYSFLHSFIHARMHSFLCSSFLPPQTSSHWVIHVVIYVFIHSLTCLFVVQSFTHGGDHPLRTQSFIVHLFQTMSFFQSFFPPTPSLCSLSSCSSFICSLIHPPISGCICTVVCLFQLYSLRHISGFVYSSLFM